MKRLACWVVLPVFLLNACGDEKEGDNGGCGTAQNPTPISVKDILPEAGSTVPNQDIQHEFTVVNPPGVLSNLNFTPGAAHTAGGRDPASVSYQSTVNGNEYTYTSIAFSWENAPAVIDLPHTGVFLDANSCVYSIPNLVFSYDVTAVE